MTAVPTGPKVGAKVKVDCGPASTVKFPAADFPVLPIKRIAYLPAGAFDATVNPALAFPPPVIEHDADDRTAEGAALSRHDESVVNPVAEPETTVPTWPDVGFSVKVPTGPAVTVKVAVAVSAAPRFVVTVTV